ncbi:MAG TPA: LuxR C-terminal-related transcriptional regulator, partial [Thermomicrobiales bacterium]|nr:LuxR C-terminal-related transcriptional regulator [Thermomicrobiales bacterium]
PLDNRRLWYRYHHLFAEVLRVHLLRDDADQIPALHKRAAEWFASQGSLDDAIRHSLTAGDAARAAELIELTMPAIRVSKQYTRALRWIGALPTEIIRNRPVLSAAHGSLLLGAGDFDGADLHLRNAEFWLGMTEGQRETDPDRADGPVVTDIEEYRKLPVMIGVYRAAHSYFLGKTGATKAHARSALANAKEHQLFLKGAAGGLLGMALWTEGDVEAAIPAYRTGIENLHKLGYLADVVSGAMSLGDMQMVQGRLRAAESEYRQAIDLALAQGEPLLLGTADLYVGLADIQTEHNDLRAAAESLERSFALAESSGLPENQFRRSLAQARLLVADGHFLEALASLDTAGQFSMRGCYPPTRSIAAMRIPILIAMGDRDAAEKWASGNAVGEDFGFLRAFELMTLARVWIASGDQFAAKRGLALLDRVLESARMAHRYGNVLELQILQALGLDQIGEGDAAVNTLTEALVFAEPEGYARLFLDEGPPMFELLRRVPTHSPMAGYAKRLLVQSRQAAPSPVASGAMFGQAGYEQLTTREVEILRLVASGMRNQEIADQLFIGLATVKRHLANLYGKLGVQHRTEALVRAKEMGLL